MGIYKSLNISIGTMIKNPEKLKFVPDHLKTRKKRASMQLKINFSVNTCPWSI